MTELTVGVTEYIADFVTTVQFDAIPADVMHLGKKSILDVLGPALAGSISETSEILHRYLHRLNVQGEATVLGTDLRLGARFAALANGTAMHADDYDDTLQAATGKFEGIHPTAPVLSALLAAAETDRDADRSGRALLTAFHAGVETSCKVFDATAPVHIVNGFHSTGSVSVLGASMAVGKLRGADTMTLRTILGMAASQAAGLSENFGTMVKPFHAGRSAETALMVGDLVADGFTASRVALESRRGYFQAYGGGWERERIEGRIGNPWSFVDRGVSLKAWPTGSLSHPAMTLFLDLVQANDVKAEDVARITLQTSESIHNALKHHRPKTELEGKFSLEFCIASIILNRRLGLRDFTDAYVQQEDIQRLINMVDYTTFTEPTARAEGYSIVTTLGEIHLKDGRVLSSRRDFGKGAKIDPMSDAEVEDKFMDCAGFAKWPHAKARQAIELIKGLENVPDIRALTACLASGAD
jgi:2-methylcitrate dehydratase PrpD